MMISRGAGLLDKTLYAIPYELHIPGYNFCGPNTDLATRLARGDRGINGLDEACRDHDIAYSQSRDLNRRHLADKILAKKALERFRSRNSSMKERLVALGVAGAMKAKVAVGMGLKSEDQQLQPYRSTSKMSCVKLMDQCEKDLQLMATLVTRCVNKISDFKIGKQMRKHNRKTSPRKLRKTNINKVFTNNEGNDGNTSLKRKIDDNDDDDDDYDEPKHKKLNIGSRKRKIDDDDDYNNNDNENYKPVVQRKFKVPKINRKNIAVKRKLIEDIGEGENDNIPLKKIKIV